MPYRASADVALAVRAAPARRPPVIRIGMLAGGTALLAAFGLVGATAATIGGIVACLGFYGLLGRAWTDAHRHVDALMSLPFPIVHDRPDAIAYDSRYKVKSLSVVTRDPSDLDPPSRPQTVRELSELLTTWGVAVHERYGVVEVRVTWSAPAGPPPWL